MRELRRLAWAAVVAGVAATPAFGQITAGGSTGGGGGGFGGGGGGAGGGGGGGSSAGGSAPTGTASAGGVSLTTMQSAPSITGVSLFSGTNAGTNTGVDASNIFRGTFANPYYQGRAGAQVNQMPGGFGVALYGTSGISRGGAGGAGGAGGGAFGGRGGAGGTASVNTADPGGILVPLPRQIAYSAVARFPTPPVPAPVLNANLTGIIARTPGLTNPAGVQVLMDGNNVILRGTVADGEEARLVEGLVRLTPGVGAIKNELNFPRP